MMAQLVTYAPAWSVDSLTIKPSDSGHVVEADVDPESEPVRIGSVDEIDVGSLNTRVDAHGTIRVAMDPFVEVVVQEYDGTTTLAAEAGALDNWDDEEIASAEQFATQPEYVEEPAIDVVGEMDALEQLVEAGCSGAQALDYLAVDVLHSPQAAWARERGVSHQAVSKNVGEAREQLAPSEESRTD